MALCPHTMTFIIKDGILKGAAQIASPNYNQRPPTKMGQICAIIIHNISLPPAKFQQTDRDGVHYVSSFFTNTLNKDDDPYFQSIHALKVSAHLFVERDGSVTQYVNFNDRAWHAGESAYLGYRNCNDFSIGIELEGTDDTPFEKVQYEALSDIIIAIYKAYPDTYRHLAGHSDIAPTRKTDPGGCFDWQRLRRLINQKYIP